LSRVSVAIELSCRGGLLEAKLDTGPVL